MIEHRANDRHLGEIVEPEQARAIAVVDVVVVVGDVVGERGGLRLERGVGGKLEIVARAISENGIGRGPGRRRPQQRAVMLHQAFERLPGQVEAVEIRVAAFERGDHAQRLRVVVEAPCPLHRRVERALAGMAERRVPEIVRECERLGEIFVDTERARDRPRNLRDFEAVGQPRAVMVALVIDKDLRLVVQPAEGGRMQDAVAVALVEGARGVRGLGIEAAAAPPRIDGIGRERARRPRIPGRFTFFASALD
jgi:hypothetical protein